MYMGEESDPPSMVGENPPYGASINYYLGSVPSGAVSIEIMDAERTAGAHADGDEGRGHQPHLVGPEVRIVPRAAAQDDAGRAARRRRRAGWDAPDAWRRPFAPLVPPGTYTVKLKAGGAEVSKPLEVRKDPNSPGSETGIREQTRITLEIRDRLNAFADLIDELELIRGQLVDVRTAIARDPRWKALVTQADDLDAKLLAVEAELFDPHVTSSGDAFYYPPKLFAKLQSLVGGMTDADFQPTGAQMEVFGMHMEAWAGLRRTAEQLRTSEVPAFNRRLAESGVPHVIGKTP